MSEEKSKPRNIQEVMPSAEEVQRELGKAKSMDDFFGKEGIFAKLFAHTIEEMLETELSEHLGYEPYEVKGRNSGNNRNGRYTKKLRSSAGETSIQVPRDRNGEFEPQVVKKQVANTNELEDKIISMYAKGMSVRDIQETLRELYGVDVSPTTLSAITDKVWELVEAWQNRSLASVYPIIYLDAIYIKLRREGKVENIAVYTVLGVDGEGHRDVLGHYWVGEGSETSNFWLSVITDLQNRGVKDIFIACMDGLSGFKEAVLAVFPQTQIQLCVIHQIRNSLKYITWTDRKAFMLDLKEVYQAATRESAEAHLRQLGEKWGDKYAVAIRSWQNNWEDLATFFAYPAEIRRLIYTTNAVEGYHRQLRKVTKSKSIFPTPEAARKLLFLANRDILKKWTMPIQNWPLILNQLVIRFEGRLAI
jgi:transposase-like protein